MHQQQRQRSRRNARDARCLAEGLWLVQIELLLHLFGKPANRRVIQLRWQGLVVMLSTAFDLRLLRIDVALVANLNLNLFGHSRIVDPGAGAR